MKKGKMLEQLIWAIRDTLKNNNTFKLMPTNTKLVDNNGIEREIDVLLKSNNIDNPEYIIIECKDFSTSMYKTKVGIGIIDAFIGKCLDIPNVKQKIIVSKTGFSKWAKLKAEKYNIHIYNLENVPLSDILINNKIYRLMPKIQILNKNWNFCVSENPSSKLIYDKIYCSDNEQIIDINKYLLNTISFNAVVSAAEKYINREKPIECFFIINVMKGLYLKDEDGNIIYIVNITIPGSISFEKQRGIPIEQNVLYNERRKISTVTELEFNNDVPHLVFVDAVNDKNSYIKYNNLLKINVKGSN